jgi:hypothetical protein
MFVLAPVFAFFLWLPHRRRSRFYVSHLIFSPANILRTAALGATQLMAWLVVMWSVFMLTVLLV